MKPGTKKSLACTGAFFVGVVLTLAYHSISIEQIISHNDVDETNNPEESLSHAARFARGYVGFNHEEQKQELLQETHNTKDDERKLLFNLSWIADAVGFGGRGGGGETKNSDNSSNNGRVGGGDRNSIPQQRAGGRGGAGDNIVEESIAASMTRTQLKLRPPPSPTNQRSPNVVAVNPYPCAIPKIRYVPWNKLTSDTQQIVALLGYDRSSWDYTTHSLLEDAPFAAFSESQKKAALFIGIDECVWDCFFNHYRAYSTEMLAELGLDGHVPTILEMQSKYWKDMSDEEKETATKFCYFEEIWNEESLGTWSR